MSQNLLAGWIPLHVGWRRGPVFVDWCRFDDVRFTEPFFSQTVSRALRDPARLLFRKRTPLNEIETFAEQAESQPPRGFIFHVSRCGSTLMAQMLAALPQDIVISEAPPLDQVIAAPWQGPQTTREQRVRWLRGMVGALAQRRRPDERDVFIKFDCWHVLSLPLIAEAFPEVPWLFLYRDPVEVMVSHQRLRGSQMIPGVINPTQFGIPPGDPSMTSLEVYTARVLASLYRAGLEHAGLGRNQLVNFSELPEVMWETLGGFFGVNWGAENLARLSAAAQQDAKSPEQPHVDDRVAKQREASDQIRRLVDTWLAEPYGQLEARRKAMSDEFRS
jgi:hypothetical protein